jgi:predicted Zn-dependent protease
LQTEGTPESIKVNGLTAITVNAKADAWSFRLAAVRVGGDVYRLTFAAKDLTPETDRRFREAIDTFRRITPEDARDVKPMRIAIATAAPGQDAGALSAGMATPDHPLENFEVLNGLDGATLEPGRRYKVVVE